VTYGGVAAQVIGIAHPVTAGVNLEIDNAAGVSLNTTSGLSNLTVGGNLILTSGQFNIQSTATARTLTINNNIFFTAGTINFSGANSDLVIGGTGALTVPVAAASTIRNLTVDRTASGVVDFTSSFSTTGTLIGNNGDIRFSAPTTISAAITMNAGTLDFNASGTITGSTTLNAGTTLFFENQSLTMNGAFVSNGGVLSANGTSTLILGGNTAFGTLVFSPTENVLGTLTVSKTGAGVVASLNSPLTISSAFNLLDGVFANNSGLTMGNGSTLTRNPEATLNINPPSGTYNLAYQGASITPALEAAGTLNNVTSNSAGTVTLTAPMTLAGQLTVNSGTFNAGAHAVSAATFLNGSTFTAPSTTFTLTGNFTNNATFNHNNGTVIFNGVSTISGSSAKTFRNIAVNTTRTLTITGETITIFNGNLTINTGAIFNSSGSTVQINGSATTQTISANNASFNNITVNKTGGGVTLASGLTLRGILNIQSATTLASNGNLLVSSTTENTSDDGRIAPLLGGAAVSGNVIVQRFMGAADNVDRFISSSVTNATVSQLQDDFSVTGDFPQTSFPCTGCTKNGESLRFYVESYQGDFDIGYTDYPVSSNTEPLVPGVGYLHFMWNGVAPLTMDLTGPVNQGTINYSISKTPSNPPNPNNDGWNLVGNPYPSSIAWNNGPGWTKNQIQSIVYVWDVDAAVYRTYDADLSFGDLPNGVVAMGQSFWVYALQPGASLSINENAKSGLSGSFFREKPSSVNGMTISLSHGSAVDNSFVLVGSEAYPDKQAPKLYGSEKLSIAPVNGEGRKLAYYTIDENVQYLRIPLAVTARENGKYEIALSSIGNFGLIGQLYLEDALLNTKTQVLKSYSFTISDNPKSYENRFFLTTDATIADENAISIEVFPNPLKGNILDIEINSQETESVRLFDSMGKSIGTVSMEASADGMSRAKTDMSNQPSGIYILKATVKGRLFIKKIFKN
jgi:hypothetical protein